MLTLATLVARAAEPSDTPSFAAPALQADLLRPGVGPAPGITSSGRLNGAVASLTAVWTRAPLVFVTEDEASLDVLRNVVAVRAAAAAGFGRVIAEFEVPAYLATDSDLLPAQSWFAGDPQLALRVVPLAGSQVSASVYGRVIPAFGASTRQLGESALSGAVGGSAAWSADAGTAVGADASVWLRPAVTFDGVGFGGTALSVGAFVRHPLGPVDGSVSARALLTLAEPASVPVEAMLGAETHGSVRLWAAAGTSLHAGIGAPSLRLLVGIRVTEPAR
jgi:hypothetical protein